jgi:prepilin-type N-terminal cleavage/methylation domain-containing protein
MRLNRQSGFSMLELMVAMMIIAVIATLGIRKYSDFSDKARYLKAHDVLETVGSGLDQYYIKHGRYPDFTSYESMIDANSVLVKENMLPVNVPTTDPWKQPFEGKSGKGEYVLKCAGDPRGNPDRPPFTQEPGKISGEPDQTQGTTSKETK